MPSVQRGEVATSATAKAVSPRNPKLANGSIARWMRSSRCGAATLQPSAVARCQLSASLSSPAQGQLGRPVLWRGRQDLRSPTAGRT